MPEVRGVKLLHLLLLWRLVFADASQAADKLFTVGGVDFVLQEGGADAEVTFQSMRLNRALNVWNVEVSIRNIGVGDLQAPLVLQVGSFAGTSGILNADGLADNNPGAPTPFIDLSNWVTNKVLRAGERSAARTLSLGISGNAAPSISMKVYARRPEALALAFARTLTAAGQPLGAVDITETGPNGAKSYQSDLSAGVVTLGQAPGSYWWKFSKAGLLPVWRRADLVNGDVAVLAGARLQERGTNVANITTGTASQLSDAGAAIRVSFGSGAFGVDASAVLTTLGQQTLPALLPMGWSPLQAFTLETSAPVQGGASATIKPWANIGLTENAAFVQWDEANLRWNVLQLVAGNGTNEVSVAIPGVGSFALVIADQGVFAPAAARAGEALQGTSSLLTDFSALSAGGKVTPPTQMASVDAGAVTAMGEIIVTNRAGAIPSGAVLRAEVDENYNLRDGSQRNPPRYQAELSVYQRPGDSDAATVGAQFALRPLFLFPAEELNAATLTVRVFAPESFQGGVLSPNGTEVTRDGIRIVAAVNDVATAQALLMRSLAPTNFTSLANLEDIQGAFEIEVGGVAAGKNLKVGFPNVSTNSTFVLARVLYERGVFGLEPVERFASDANGKLASGESTTGAALNGLTWAGQYLLIKVAGPQALVTGVARDVANHPAAGILVRRSPWMTFSASDGSYRLLAPSGDSSISFLDLVTGNVGSSSVTVSNTAGIYAIDGTATPLGPQVISISPADGATAVSRVSSVVVTFSKGINPGSLGTAGVQLLDAAGNAVACSLSFNLKNTIVTLLPTAQLAANARYTIKIARSVADPNGLPLEGPNSFSFVTQSDALARVGAQVISHEPENGLAKMEGSPGTADPEAPVILVNDTTGKTATVLSKPDGSFSNFIEASVDDALSAVMVNQNGTRTIIPVSRQLFKDGSVGLFNGGGILEAQSDGGPSQVIVEPGAIPEKTRFQYKPLPLLQVMQLLAGVQPESGRVLVGFSFEEQGDELKVSMDVSIPIAPETLGLPPGRSPENATFALTVPHRYDGTTVFEVVDGMSYENGKLVTHSPPFPGMEIRKLIRNASASTLHDQLQEAIGEQVHSLEASVGLMLAPTMMADGSPTTLIGRVTSVRVDSNGVPLAFALQKPVPGAVVAVIRDNLETNAPGQLHPGQYVAITDEKGEFALRVPSETLQDPSGVTLRATHPRFPTQRATASLTRAPGTETPFGRFNLAFKELDFSSLKTADFLAPIIHVALTPADPLIGTNRGAKVTVTVIDDRAVNTLIVITNGLVPLYTGTNITNSVELTEKETRNPNATTLERDYKLTATAKSRVTLNIKATDTSGNITEQNYDVTFNHDDDNPGGPPPDANDQVGPRVVMAWPPNGSTGVAPDEPIVLRFSEPVALGKTTKLLSFSTPHSVQTAILSNDQRELTIAFSGTPSGRVDYSINRAEIKDLAGNLFDQGGGASFGVHFNLAGQTSANLPELQNGGGIVQKGAYAYALERQGESGKLLVYDVSDPANPTKVGSYDKLPSYPRDLCLIPNYKYTLSTNNAACVTNDLLAVVSGLLGAPTTDAGTPVEGQLLTLLNISDPTKPSLLVNQSIALTYSIAAVTKIRWSQPHLAYLEAGADSSSVGLVNLQSLLVGFNASDDVKKSFPVGGLDGVDKDGDRCYCATNDVVPLPEQNPVAFYGKEFTFTGPTDSNRNPQTIVDFDFESRFGLLGLLLNGDANFDPKYQTVYSAAGFLDPDLATLTFPKTNIARRMLFLPEAQVLISSSTPETRNLALVAMQGDQTLTCTEEDIIGPGQTRIITTDTSSKCPLHVYGTLIVSNAVYAISNKFIVDAAGVVTNLGTILAAERHISGTYVGNDPLPAEMSRQKIRSEQIYVIDVTDPLAPTALNVLLFPRKTSPNGPEIGRVLSMQLRADGKIAVATDTVVVLLETKHLLAGQQSDQESWPLAMTGVIDGAGSGARSFDSGSTGINLVNLGGKHSVIKSPPFLDIVTFADTNSIKASNLAATNEFARLAVFKQMSSPSLLLKTRFAFTNGNLAPNPPPHLYYVLGHISGKAGQTIDLALESIDPGGASYGITQSNGIPVRLATDGTRLALNDTNTTQFPRSLRARRLSDDPKSDFYNRYLSDPFQLVEQTLTDSQRQLVISAGATPAAFLRPGKFVWAGFDPGASGNTIMGEYVSKVASLHLIPGTHVKKQVEKERLPLIFIPGMAASRLADLSDFPTEDSGAYPGFMNLVQTFAYGLGELYIATERWPGLLVPNKMRLTLSPYDSHRFGNSYPTIAPYDVIRYIPELACGNLSPFRDQNCYGPLIDRLKREGYTEYLYTNNLIAAYDAFRSSQAICQNADIPYFASSTPNLFVYPYDWRYDNTNAARQLTNLIKIVKRLYPEAEKVNLLAHSMGGLVARRFALDHPELVDKVVTVGTPWLGTPKAINAVETGDFGLQETIIDHPTLKKLANYFPSAHQLLPSSNYFRFGASAYPLAEAGYDLDGNGVNNDVLDFTQYKRTIDFRYHSDPASKPIARANQPFHGYLNNGAAQDDWTSDTTAPRYFHLYGVQRAPLTITRMVATGRLREVTQTNNNLRLDLPEKFRDADKAAALFPRTAWVEATNYFVIRKEYQTERGAGDQTVTELSLSRKNASLNLNRPDAQLVAFYSTNFASDADVEHTQILSTRRVQNAILDAISDVPPLGDPPASGNVGTFSVRITGLSRESLSISNAFGHRKADEFTDSALAQVLDALFSAKPAAAGFVQGVYQQASAVAVDTLNSAINYLTGFDLFQVDPNTVELEFVSGVPAHIEFKTGNQPLAVRVQQKNNAAPNQQWSWSSVHTDAGTKLQLNFQNGTVSDLTDDAGQAYGEPQVVTLGGVIDYTPPTLTTNLVVAGNNTYWQFTVTDNIPIMRTNYLVFIGQDLDGDGTALDDKWLPITNYPPSINVTNLNGKTLFAIAQDESGNLSRPIKLQAIQGGGNPCDLFTEERQGVLNIVAAGLAEALNQHWLLDIRDIAILEQGSGACLWANNFCTACAGVYTPGKSDHDFEVFLPVQVPLGSLILNYNNAYLPANTIGNWYHKPPVSMTGSGANAVYTYELPPGVSVGGQTTLTWSGMPASGNYKKIDSAPLTPAQIITTLLDRERVLPQYLRVLPDVSFFPERREHFENGILHLERPPNEGDDPIGDAGLGRQMLLLKWLFEGRYIPGYEGRDPNQIYTLMRANSFPSGGTNAPQSGIPIVEGYEWGILQEHTALKSGILLRVEDMTDPADPNPESKNFMYETFVGQIKKAGKGAIRTTLAKIVGSGKDITPLFIDLSAYNYPTFEDYIAERARTQFQSLFNSDDLTLIAQSAKAKVADPDFVKGLLADECAANTYLANAYNFIRNAQQYTLNNYNAAMQYLSTNGSPSDLAQFNSRLSNTNWVITQVQNPPSLSTLRAHGSLDLVLRVFNEGRDSLSAVDFRMYIDGAVHDAWTNDLAPYQVFYKQGFHYTRPGKPITPFYVEVDNTPSNYGVPHVVDLVVSAAGTGSPAPGGDGPPYLTKWEPNPADNWIRFRYYLFDPSNPCPTLPDTTVQPPPNLDLDPNDISPGNRDQR